MARSPSPSPIMARASSPSPMISERERREHRERSHRERELGPRYVDSVPAGSYASSVSRSVPTRRPPLSTKNLGWASFGDTEISPDSPNLARIYTDFPPTRPYSPRRSFSHDDLTLNLQASCCSSSLNRPSADVHSHARRTTEEHANILSAALRRPSPGPGDYSPTEHGKYHCNRVAFPLHTEWGGVPFRSRSPQRPVLFGDRGPLVISAMRDALAKQQASKRQSLRDFARRGWRETSVSMNPSLMNRTSARV